MKNLTARLINQPNILVAVSFLLHIVVTLAMCLRKDKLLYGDTLRYIELSKSLINGLGYGINNQEGVYELEGYRLPGYPLFLVIFRFIFGDNYTPVIFVQAILFIISVYFVWKITEHLFGKTTGLYFLFVSAFYPFIAYYVPKLLTEICCVFLVSAAMYLIIVGERKTFKFFLAGILICLSAYFRPNLVLLAPFMFLIFLVWGDKSLRMKAVVFLLGAILMITPLVARNYLTFGVISFTQPIKASGASLYIATWQYKVSYETLLVYGQTEVITEEMKTLGIDRQIIQINREIGVPDSTSIIGPAAYPNNEKMFLSDTVLTKYALDNIKNDPFGYAGSTFKNAFRMWFSGAYDANGIPKWLGIILFILGVGSLFLAIFGCYFSVFKETSDDKVYIYLIIGICIYHSITLCWLHTEARYTIPVRLFFLSMVAVAVAYIISFIGRKIKLEVI